MGPAVIRRVQRSQFNIRWIERSSMFCDNFRWRIKCNADCKRKAIEYRYVDPSTMHMHTCFTRNGCDVSDALFSLCINISFGCCAPILLRWCTFLRTCIGFEASSVYTPKLRQKRPHASSSKSQSAQLLGCAV